MDIKKDKIQKIRFNISKGNLKEVEGLDSQSKILQIIYDFPQFLHSVSVCLSFVLLHLSVK